MSPDPKIPLDQIAVQITTGLVVTVDPDAMAAFEDEALDLEAAQDNPPAPAGPANPRREKADVRRSHCRFRL